MATSRTFVRKVVIYILNLWELCHSIFFSSGSKSGSNTRTGVHYGSGSATTTSSSCDLFRHFKFFELTILTEIDGSQAFPYLRPFSPRTFCVLVAMMMISVLVGVTRTSTPLYPSSASSRVNSSFSSACAHHYLKYDYTEHTISEPENTIIQARRQGTLPNCCTRRLVFRTN